MIEDKFALRAVFYEEKRGGYIHNIPGTFAREPTDGGIAYYFGGVVPPNSVVLSNSGLVNHDYNPVTYKGSRFSALFQFNDDWNLGLQQSFQTLEADGVFAYAPALGDLNIQQYNPSYDHDKFQDTAWTLNGRIGPLKAVYTGGYLDPQGRAADRLHRLRARGAGCVLPVRRAVGELLRAAGKVTQDTCYSPSSVWFDKERNTHESHELRFSTPDDQRLRAIVGGFYGELQDPGLDQLAVRPGGGRVPAVRAAARDDDLSTRQCAGRAWCSSTTSRAATSQHAAVRRGRLRPRAEVADADTRYALLLAWTTTTRASKNSAYGCRN